MMMVSIKVSMQASAAVAALLVAAPGLGQAPSAPAGAAINAPQGAAISPAAPGETEGGLEEIVVTAQRFAESSQRAPIAIDVLKPEELTRQFVTRAEDLSRASPALAASGGAGGTTAFFVRGVGNATVNGYSDPAIAFNYDGVYIGRPSSTSGVFYDLQRVEVLKGPQGTLYGRNATGGAINVIPNRPRLKQNSAEATVSYGNFDWLTAQGAVNAAIGDTVAVRVAGNLTRHDAFQTDGTGSQREYGGRVQIYAEPAYRLNLRVAADYAHQGGASSSGFYLGAVDPTFGPTGFAGYRFTPSGFSRQQGIGDPASQQYLAARFLPQTGRAGAVIDGTPFNDNDYWGVTGELNYTTEAGTLTVQPAYRESHLDYSFTGIFRDAGTKEDDRQASVEARWAGQIATGVEYLLGGMYFDEKIDGTARYNQFTLTPYQDFSTRTKSWAGFGKLTVRPTSRLSLTAAGRYTSDRKRFDGTSNVYILFCGNPAPPQDLCPTLPFAPLVGTEAALQGVYAARNIPITPVPLYVLPPQAGGSQTAPFVLRSPIVIDAGLNNTKFTYRLAAQYDLGARSMVYASFETGYHAGGFSFARGIETYAPESIKAYTLGTKNRFLDNRLQVNLEAFYWKYKNQQFSQFGFDLGNPPSTVLLTRNIGNSTIKGLDLDTELLVTPTTLLSANVQYLDTNYDSFVYFAPNQGLPPNTSCGYAPVTQTTPGGARLDVFRVDCSGRQAFNSPKWSLNLNAQQTVPLGSTRLVLQAGTRYRGDTYSSSDYLPYLKGRANFVSNASITLSSADERWFASLYAFNLENSQRLSQATVNSAGLFVGNAEQPRTYGVRIGSKF